MMDGLLLVCLTGICASPNPLLLYERLPASLERTLASTSSAAVAAPSLPNPRSSPAIATALHSRASARPSEESPATIQAPSPIEEADRPGATTGGTVMSRATIAAIVDGKLDTVRRCYERGLLDDPTFNGTIEMGWKIDVAGHVTSTNVAGAGTRSPAIEECLHSEIMRWTFPASAEPVVIGSYPFTFDAALLRHHAGRADRSAAALSR